MNCVRTTCIAAALLVPSFAAFAETVSLKMGTWGPPKSYFYVDVLEPWAERVNKDSGGTLDVKHIPGGVLGDPRTMLSAVMSDVAQIGWALPHTNPGKFVKSSIIELPFGYDSGESGAVAYWRLYEKGLIASDFEGVKLLGLTAWPAASIMSRNKEITRLEDLKGMKFRVTGQLQSATVTQFGGTPVAVPVNELNQALSKGVIDAAWVSITGLRSFRLHEVTNHFLKISLNGAGGMLIMNQKRYDKLPAEARAAIDRHSGEVLSRALGRANDEEVGRAEAIMAGLVKAGTHTMTSLDPAEEARWKTVAEPVIERWVDDHENGRAILAAFRAEVDALEKR